MYLAKTIILALVIFVISAFCMSCSQNDDSIDVTGTWSWVMNEIYIGYGQMTGTASVVQKGKSISGTGSFQGNDATITGTLSGDTVTLYSNYAADPESNSTATGTVKGDTIELKMDMGEGGGGGMGEMPPIVLKKVK